MVNGFVAAMQFAALFYYQGISDILITEFQFMMKGELSK